MKYLHNYTFMITIDSTGRIELWDPITLDFPK